MSAMHWDDSNSQSQIVDLSTVLYIIPLYFHYTKWKVAWDTPDAGFYKSSPYTKNSSNLFIEVRT